MTAPTREEQRRLVSQWEATGRILDALRRDALRGLEYRWQDVDALLSLGDRVGLSRPTSGLIEQQRLFMKAAKQGKQSVP